MVKSFVSIVLKISDEINLLRTLFIKKFAPNHSFVLPFDAECDILSEIQRDNTLKEG